MATRPQKSDPQSPDQIPADYGDLGVSKWGLDWADISQIRERLAMTPAERLQAAQRLLNAAIRIRAKNGD